MDLVKIDGKAKPFPIGDVTHTRSWDVLQAWFIFYFDKTIENCSKRSKKCEKGILKMMIHVKSTTLSKKKYLKALTDCNVPAEKQEEFWKFKNIAVGKWVGMVSMGPRAKDKDLLPGDPHVLKKFNGKKIEHRYWLTDAIAFDPEDFVSISRFPSIGCIPATITTSFKNLIKNFEMIERYSLAYCPKPMSFIFCPLCGEKAKLCVKRKHRYFLCSRKKLHFANGSIFPKVSANGERLRAREGTSVETS